MQAYIKNYHSAPYSKTVAKTFQKLEGVVWTPEVEIFTIYVTPCVTYSIRTNIVSNFRLVK